MDRLEAMTVLLSAVDSGSLSAASRRLRISLATVSRRVSELEEHLKIRLLLRGNRKLVLTDAGRGYVASCRRIVEAIAEAERTASGEYRVPQGELIVSVAPAFGRIHLMPLIPEFLRTYPDIRVRVQLNDRTVNLVEEHIDLAIRVGELPDSSMIATRIGLVRHVVCAAPPYLKARGTPKKPADLREHDCIAYEGNVTGISWDFRSGETSDTIEISSRLVVNSPEAAVIAAEGGAGIARVLSYQVDHLVKSRSLLALLEQYETLPTAISVVYPSQRKPPLKLRAFLDFSVPRLRDRLGYKGR